MWNALFRIAAFAGVIWLATGVSAHAQQAGGQASATAVTASTGRPNTLQLKQNALRQQQAALSRELVEVNRCLRISSQSQVLRDPEGNLNQVPEIDLVNCARRLASLQRQQNNLARAAKQLAQDAQAQANAAQRALEATRTKARLQAISGTSGTRRSSKK
jgi:hypothetical protein